MDWGMFWMVWAVISSFGCLVFIIYTICLSATIGILERRYGCGENFPQGRVAFHMYRIAKEAYNVAIRDRDAGKLIQSLDEILSEYESPEEQP